MNSQLLRLYCLCLLCFCMTTVFADDNDLDELQMKLGAEWRLVKNDQLRHIQTFARLEDGKRYRSFKASLEMEAKPESLARLLLDFDNYSRWYWQVQESRLIKKVSGTEYYIYMIHRAPFGLPDRDVILHAIIEPQTSSRPYVVLRVNAVPDYMPSKEPYIRMLAEDMTFKFTPLANNKIAIEAEGYVDPGGKVPSWAANFVQHSAPYSVALGAMRMVQKDSYAKSESPLPFAIYQYSDYEKR